MLDINQTLWNRDEKGELIPKEVFVKTLNNSVLITPITLGEWYKLRSTLLMQASGKTETTPEQNVEVLLKHCIQPKFSKEQIDKGLIKIWMVEAIVAAIFEHSGLVPDNSENDSEKKKNG